MFNLLYVEFYKILKNKVFWVMTNIIIFTALIASTLYFLETKEWLTPANKADSFLQLEAHVNQVEFGLQDGISFFMFVEAAPELLLTVLLISILGAFMISTEHSNSTMKNLISIGYGREKIYLTKLCVFFIATFFLHRLMAISFGVFGTLFLGIGFLPSYEELLLIGKVISISTFYLLAFTSIAIFFAILIKGSGIAILTTLTFFLAFGPFLSMLGQKYLLFEKINHYSVYSRFMDIIISDLNNSMTIIELILIPIITTIVFTMLGIIVFKRKDIH